MNPASRSPARVIAACLVALMLLASLTTQALARPRPHFLGRSAQPLQADGQRYAAFSVSASVLRLLDLERGSARSLSVPSGCRVDDGARGLFLVNCPNAAGFTVPKVLSARSGQLHVVPGENQTWFPNADDFGRIGSQWLQGGTAGNGHPITEYLNWHSGKVKFGEGSGDPTVPRDLNSVSLAPLASNHFQLFLRNKSTVVSERRAANLASPLLLKRSHRPVVTLDRCPHVCTSVTLGRIFVSWATGQVARVYMLGTGQRMSWHFQRTISNAFAGPAEGVMQAGHTLFFNVPLMQSPQTRFRIYKLHVS
jgi:hypothetical protein